MGRPFWWQEAIALGGTWAWLGMVPRSRSAREPHVHESQSGTIAAEPGLVVVGQDAAMRPDATEKIA